MECRKTAARFRNCQRRIKTGNGTHHIKENAEKNLLEVVDFAKSGNVFGRCYQPTISIMEFELDRLSAAFESRQCTEITLSKYIAALLDNMDKETALRELENLEKMIAEKRKSLAGTD